MLGCLHARLDPEGRAIADELERSLNDLSWAQVGWLINHDPHRWVTESRRGPRQIHVHAIWDMDEWASDTYVWIAVSVIASRPRMPKTFGHRALAGHAGETLPEAPPPPEPVDLASITAQATG